MCRRFDSGSAHSRNPGESRGFVISLGLRVFFRFYRTWAGVKICEASWASDESPAIYRCSRVDSLPGLGE
jgi:hypothetical protein